MAFPAVPATGSHRPGGLLNIQSACDGSVLKKCQCSGLGWKVEACARWPGSPRAAGVTRELPPCRHPLQSTPINTQGSPSRKCPRMFMFFKYPLAPERNIILARRPLVEASVFRQGNVPAASQSTPQGCALPGSRRGHSAQVWQMQGWSSCCALALVSEVWTPWPVLSSRSRCGKFTAWWCYP